MSRPLPLPVRQNVFRRWRIGDTAAAIAHNLQLVPRTVRRLVQRFRERGADAIHPLYSQRQSRPPPAVLAAVALRQEHRRWGAPLIRVLLRHRFADDDLPSPRTLQRWFARAGLGPAPKGRRPAAARQPRAGHPHAVWQMDAAEQLALTNNQQVCWLRIVDEYSGAVLRTVVFAEALFNQVPPVQTQQTLRKTFTVWGLPGALRVDNGPPWGSKGDLPTDLALWVLGLRVDMIWNPPRRPQHNAVVERFQGVGQCWLEPGSCSCPEELQRNADRLDRVQREEYPVVEGQSRLAVHPGLEHSGRTYNRAWERRHWDLSAVAEQLAGYRVPRRVDDKGMISLYNRNRYVGRQHAGKAVWVTFDPQALVWVVLDAKGNAVRDHLAAPEICRDRIMSLTVTNRRREDA